MKEIDKIAIIGAGYLGSDFNSPVRLKDRDKPKDVIIIEGSKTITINGIEYKRIPQKPKETGRKSALIAMMAMFEYTNPYGSRKVHKTPPVSDIEAEFELIQKKQSNLSRSQRDSVEAAFMRLYRVVKK